MHQRHHQRLQQYFPRKTPQTIDQRNPVKIRDLYDTAPFMKNNITKKESKGRRCRCHTHLANEKRVERTEEKERRRMEERHNHRNNNKNNHNHRNNNNNQLTKELKQLNLDGIIVKL